MRATAAAASALLALFPAAAGAAEPAPAAAPDAAPAAAAPDSAPPSEATTASDAPPPADPAPAPAAPLPPLDPRAQDDYVEPRDGPRKPSRLVELGGLFGSVIRPSGGGGIGYNTGYFFGAFVRAELRSWLGIRLTYREEHVPVDVSPGGFDYNGTKYPFEFTQPDLEIITLGARVEPTWVITPRFRVFGVLGIGWLRMDAPVPEAPGFSMQGKRSATEVNVPLGVGLSYELIPNWVNTSLSFTYGFSIDQNGRAYEPLQAIVDGKITYLAPLPHLQSVGDLTFSVGVIL